MTVGERLVSAALGVVLGSLVGLALAWAFGVRHDAFGQAAGVTSFFKLVGSTSVVFGLLGLVFGSHAGALLGEFITALFAIEGAYDGAQSERHVPTWAVVTVLLVVVLAVAVFVKVS